MAESESKKMKPVGKLYHIPFCSSSKVVQLVHELNISTDVEIVIKNRPDLKATEYLKINPLGLVPAYQEGEFILIESSAIFLYLLEKFDKENKLHLANADTATRGKLFQFAIFGPASMMKAMGPLWNKEASDQVKEAAKVEWRSCAALIERELGEKKYLLGDEFSAIDLVITMDLTCAKFLNLLDETPKLKEYFNRLSSRESYKLTYPSS